MTDQKKPPSPNDQRSNVKNPNNPAHKAAQDNRANQMNPNHQPSKGGPAPKPGNG
jgi:hypothetical protein